MEKQNINHVKEVYKKRSKKYNFYVKLFPLIGWRANGYRKPAVKLLNLKKGDTVVDLCCGTGLNFPLIIDMIGPEGKLIGVDLSENMLTEAAKSIKENGWNNVELINMDASKYKFPDKLSGIITSYAITLIPQYDEIISNGAKALVKNGRFVVLDFKRPEKWPFWFTKVMLTLFVKPFGGSLEMADRYPWESLKKYLQFVSMNDYYFGSTYIAVGEKK